MCMFVSGSVGWIGGGDVRWREGFWLKISLIINNVTSHHVLPFGSIFSICFLIMGFPKTIT